MRSIKEVMLVLSLAERGLTSSAIARLSGIPRRTIVDWRASCISNESSKRECYVCSFGGRREFPSSTYAYLLGLYLGDGCLSRYERGVYRLRIFLDQKYRCIVDECKHAMGLVIPNNRVHVLSHSKDNVMIVSSYSKHWQCMFPQHGPGRKHERPIVLTAWQQRIIDDYPRELIRGLIHSDGTRHLNKVGGSCYPRYQFTNVSEDIREIFCNTCNQLGIRWKRMNHKTISIARARDVAIMDSFVGPKK